MKLKKIALGISAALIILIAVAAVWSLSPVTVDQQSPDPAVALLNERAASELRFREAYFDHEGLRLHYIEAGAGTPVVLIHGFPSFWYSLSRQIEDLAADYRVIAIDGLGAGKSDAPADVSAYELEPMAEHVLALLDALAVNEAHLVGHDWGSALAIGMAQRYPQRVLSVTGISAPPLNVMLKGLQEDASVRETFSYVERFKKANALLLAAMGVGDTIFDSAYQPLIDGGQLSEREGAFFRRATGNPKRINAHINWYRANLPAPQDITADDYWPERDVRVTVPALYIWGDEDPIFNRAILDMLLGLSDDAQLRVLPGLGHWPHMLEADTVSGAIREHLSEQSRSG